MSVTLSLVMSLCLICSVHANEARRTAHWFPDIKTHFTFDTGCNPAISTEYANYQAALSDTSGAIELILSTDTFIHANGVSLKDTLNTFATITYGSFNTTRTTIVPTPGKNTYMIFSLIHTTTQDVIHMYAREIDMIDGRTISLQRILPTSNVGDFGIIERANLDGYWIVCSASEDAYAHAFPLTDAGLEADVTSPWTPVSIEYLNGSMSFSPTGKNVSRTNGQEHIFLYDFDTRTGQLSNETTIPITGFGVTRGDSEFSPDGSKLYVNINGPNIEIVQIDLSKPTISDISASAVMVTPPNTTAFWTETDLQLGPDGKIYCRSGVQQTTGGHGGEPYIGEILCPNLPGLECGLTLKSLNVSMHRYDLPRFVYTWFNDERILGKDKYLQTKICPGKTLLLKEVQHVCATQYHWTRPDGVIINSASCLVNSISTQDEGTYTFMQVRCSDTIRTTVDVDVVESPITGVIYDHMPLCPGDSVSVILLSSGPVDDVQWDNGTTGDSTQYKTSGDHTVTVTYAGCEFTSTFTVYPDLTIGAIENQSFVYDIGCSGRQSITSVQVINTANNDVDVVTAYFVHGVLELVSPSVPFRMPKDQGVTLEFKPVDPITDEFIDTLIVEYGNCRYKAYIEVVGQVSDARIAIAAPDTAGRIDNSRFSLPIYAQSSCTITRPDSIVIDVSIDNRLYYIDSISNATLLAQSTNANINTYSLMLTDMQASDSMNIHTWLHGRLLLGTEKSCVVEMGYADVPSFIKEQLAENGSITVEGCALPLLNIKHITPVTMKAVPSADNRLNIYAMSQNNPRIDLRIYSILGEHIASVELASGTWMILPTPMLPGLYILTAYDGVQKVTQTYMHH